MKNERRVFLDLEDTVIDTFMDNERFIHVTEMRNFLKSRNIKEVEIFSRAIWTKKEKDHFNKLLKRHFPDILGVEVVGDVPTVQDLIKMISKNKKLSLMSRNDFWDFFDKYDSFYQMVLFFIKFKQIKNTEFILIDDMVLDHKIEFVQFNVSIETINIKTIWNNFS